MNIITVISFRIKCKLCILHGVVCRKSHNRSMHYHYAFLSCGSSGYDVYGKAVRVCWVSAVGKGRYNNIKAQFCLCVHISP